MFWINNHPRLLHQSSGLKKIHTNYLYLVSLKNGMPLKQSQRQQRGSCQMRRERQEVEKVAEQQTGQTCSHEVGRAGDQR